MAKSRRYPPPAPAAPKPTSPAERLAHVRTERHALDVTEAQLVGQLRGAGASWAEIGRLAGMSKAGAHRKWGRPSTNDDLRG